MNYGSIIKTMSEGKSLNFSSFQRKLVWDNLSKIAKQLFITMVYYIGIYIIYRLS